MNKKNNFIRGLKRTAKHNLANFKQEQSPINDKRFKTPEEYKEKYDVDEKVNEEFPEDLKENFRDNLGDDSLDDYKLRPAQKPESFHRFILENEYTELEREIRGLKDVWSKELNKYVTKKADNHCFTNEEAEFIVRMAQTHLTTTIKLGIMTREQFDIKLMAIYSQVERHFREISEYRFGRFGGLHAQQEMKNKAFAIFTSIMSNIFQNYSRSVEGMENKATHDSVRGQESLQQTTPLGGETPTY